MNADALPDVMPGTRGMEDVRAEIEELLGQGKTDEALERARLRIPIEEQLDPGLYWFFEERAPYEPRKVTR